MILIYTTKLTNRIKYIFNFMLTDILGLETDYTTDRSEYISHSGPGINYSEQEDLPGLWLEPAGLLHERGIAGQAFSFLEYEGLNVFYPVYGQRSLLPFDPFSFCFYLLSRYEEHLPYVKDEFGRFQARDSLAYRKGFLKRPVIDILAFKIFEILKAKYPGLQVRKRQSRFIPTIDINAAYAYKHKGLIRTTGGLLKAFRNLDAHDMTRQARVLLNRDPDPFDTYQEQLAIQKKYAVDPIYFILFASYATNDRNISVNNRKFQILIKTLADYARVGIHSSYSSTQNPESLANEIRTLSGVLNREIDCVRQHFLLLQIPLTYRHFINEDIFEDYSMGYPRDPGFRAGTSYPFRFFDLDLETVTHLVIHPFAFQDIALESGYTLEDYVEILDEVRSVGGDMIILFNNENFSRKILNKKGVDLYETLIKHGVEQI